MAHNIKQKHMEIRTIFTFDVDELRRNICLLALLPSNHIVIVSHNGVWKNKISLTTYMRTYYLCLVMRQNMSWWDFSLPDVLTHEWNLSTWAYILRCGSGEQSTTRSCMLWIIIYSGKGGAAERFVTCNLLLTTCLVCSVVCEPY